MVAASFWFTEPLCCSDSESWKLSSSLSLSFSSCCGSWQLSSLLFLCCTSCCGSWQQSSSLSLSCSSFCGSCQPASSLFLCCNRSCGSWLLPLSSLVPVLWGSRQLPSSLLLRCTRCCVSWQPPSSLSLSSTTFCRLRPYVLTAGRADFSASGVSVPLVARSRRRSSILWRPKDRKRSGLTAGDSARLSSVF
jgi:hypothetical protein